MAATVESAIAALQTAWRDYVTEGVPASGENEPDKPEIRTAFATLKDALESGISAASGNIIRFATVAERDADTSQDDGQLAYVYDNNGDPEDPLNGVYQYDTTAPGWEAAPWYFNSVAAVVQPLVEDAEAAATLSQAWAEGTEPAGPGTKSSKEWSEVSEAAAAGLSGSLATLGALDDLFLTVPPRNLYDPALAENGQIRNFTTGIKTAQATSILSGKVPVTEGLRYTWSQRYPRTGFYPHVYAWNGSTYLGALGSLPGSNVEFLQPTESGGASNGHLQISGTIPVGSNVTHVETLLLYPYAAHDTPTFDLIRNGVQFEVGSEPTEFEAYTTTGRRELDDAGLPEAAVLSRDAFTVRPGKNIYNKALAVDQSLYSFTSGNPSANTIAARSGKVPVVPGQVLTASVPDTARGFLGNIHAWGVDNNYLGMAELQTTNAVVAGFNLVKKRANGLGYRELTFTVPPAVYFVGFSLFYPYFAGHTTADFNAVIDVFQIEEGTVATSYEAYGAPDIAILNDAALEPVPAYSTAPEDDEVVLQIVGDLAYVRGRLGESTTLDVVHLLTRRAVATFVSNQVLNFDGAKYILRETVADATALAYLNNGTTMAVQGDDTTPVKYNGSYMGGNGHGVAQMRALGIPTGHGKTSEDEGSEYDNGAGVSFYIVRVFDEFTLWVLSENIGASEALWEFNTTIGGSTLTHVAGGTNTGDITFSTNVSANWTPSTFNRTLTIRVDGEEVPWEDAVYVGRRVEIDEVREISNPASALDYMIANVGSPTPIYPTDPSIAGQVRTALTYRFAENGSVSVYHPLQIKQELNLDIFGVVQASRISVPAGGYPQEFMPNTTGLTADFEAGVNVSGAAVPSNFVTPAKWDDPDDPPCFMGQRAIDSTAAPKWQFSIGISPLSGVGVPAIRKTLISDAMFNGATGKMYVEAMSAGGSALPVPVPAGSYYDAVGFRIFGHADSTPAGVALFGWYYDGEDVGVMAHFTAAADTIILPLPGRFIGWTATLASGPNATLRSGRVTPDGLVVTVAAPGGIVVKLTA